MKELIANNHYRIQSIIKKITGNYSEDIEQEVYIKAIKNINKYKEKNKFTQWINTITANLCKDYLKSAAFKNAQNSISDDFILDGIVSKNQTEAQYCLKERQKIILKAIDSLPKKMKQVIVLFEFEDYTYEQIAKKLNIPIGTVKSRINQARKILQKSLQFLIGDD